MSNNREQSSVERSAVDVSVPSSNQARPTQPADRASIHDQIRTRAYELYLARGDEPSDAMSDWLRAEREYLERDDDRGSVNLSRPSQERA